MNDKIKNVFEKGGVFFSILFLCVLSFLFGKILPGKRDGTESDSARNKPSDDFSRDAERISEEARISKESIFNIIERIKKREPAITNES